MSFKSIVVAKPSAFCLVHVLVREDEIYISVLYVCMIYFHVFPVINFADYIHTNNGKRNQITQMFFLGIRKQKLLNCGMFNMASMLDFV